MDKQLTKNIRAMDELVALFNKAFPIGLLLFIFLLFSFQRAFSVINVSYIFITEVTLFFCLFYCFFNRRYLLKIPSHFLIPISIYCLTGFLYFLKTLAERNMYGVRDIVFFAYPLFLPATFIIFSTKNRLKIFLAIILLSNIVSLLVPILYLEDIVYIKPFKMFFYETRIFNYGLTYGVSFAFLIQLFILTRRIIYKTGIMLVCASSIAMIAYWGLRSALVALLPLGLFMLITLRKQLFKFMLYSLLIFPLIFAASSSLSMPQPFKNVKLLEKLTTLKHILQEKITPRKSQGPLTEKNTDNLESPYYSSLKWRFDIWQTILRAGLEAPLFGRGFGVLFIVPSGRRMSFVGVNSGLVPAHNHIIAVFSKMGFFGLVLFLFMNIYVFFYCLEYLKQTGDKFTKYLLQGCLGAFIFWHAMALFFDVIDSPPTTVILWIIIGLIFACIEVDKERIIEEAGEKTKLA